MGDESILGKKAPGGSPDLRRMEQTPELVVKRTSCALLLFTPPSHGEFATRRFADMITSVGTPKREDAVFSRWKRRTTLSNDHEVSSLLPRFRVHLLSAL